MNRISYIFYSAKGTHNFINNQLDYFYEITYILYIANHEYQGLLLEEQYCTAGTAGTYASGDVASTLRETLMQAVSLNEEAPSFRWG